jgi:hypothetical protein
MKMRSNALILGFILSFAALVAEAQEVPMANPGFESFGPDPNDPVNGWIEFDGNSNGCTGSPWRQGGSTCSPLDDNPEGAQVISSRFTATHTDADDVALAQVVSVTPAMVYEVSCWIHFSIENDRDENDNIYLRAADGDVSGSLDCSSVQTAGVLLASATASPLCDNWRRISGQITVYSSEMTVVTGVDYHAGGGGGGMNVCFWDDFHVTVVGPAPPGPSETDTWEVYR